ncbi:MAG: hypothetical protein Hals2KO_22110 [Halioglobus sp.]
MPAIDQGVEERLTTARNVRSRLNFERRVERGVAYFEDLQNSKQAFDLLIMPATT